MSLTWGPLYIGVCTHREALQQVAFSVGAVVDDSRSNNIKIYKVRRSLVATINKDRKFTGSKISLRNFVSEVAITIHKYTKGMTEEKLFSGQLHKGRNEVIFKEPCQVTKGVGCTILEKSTNYAIVQVETAQECTINGYKYTDQSSIYTTLIDKMPSGELPNAIKVTDATLVTMDNVGEIARNLLDYYSLRQVSNIKYLIRDEKVGTWTALQSQFGETFAGCLEKQTINLTGGFISNAEIVGYDRELINYDYMPEFNAGEEMGLF